MTPAAILDATVSPGVATMTARKITMLALLSWTLLTRSESGTLSVYTGYSEIGCYLAEQRIAAEARNVAGPLRPDHVANMLCLPPGAEWHG